MNRYISTLILTIGEYEKASTVLVTAESHDEAVKKALLAECHSELNDGAEFEEHGISDLNGEFFYTNSSTNLISETEFDVMKKHLCTIH